MGIPVILLEAKKESVNAISDWHLRGHVLGFGLGIAYAFT